MKNCSQFADGDTEVPSNEITCSVSHMPPLSISPALSHGLPAVTCCNSTVGQKAVQIFWAIPIALMQWRESIKLTSVLAHFIRSGQGQRSGEMFPHAVFGSVAFLLVSTWQ